MTENRPRAERKTPERRRTRRAAAVDVIEQVAPLPPGIDPEAIGHAQIDDAYLASEESDASHRAREIEREERRARVIALKRAGASFRAIAEQLGISVSTAYSDYRTAVERLIPVEDLEAARQLELDRLDRIHMAHWPAAIDPNHPETYDAVRAVLNVSDRRAKLMGMDKPSDRGPSDPSEVASLETIDQKIFELIEEMERRERWLGG